MACTYVTPAAIVMTLLLSATYCNPDLSTEECASARLVVQAAAAAFGHAMTTRRYVKVFLFVYGTISTAGAQDPAALSGPGLHLNRPFSRDLDSSQ